MTRSFSGQLTNLQKGDAGVMQLLAYQSSAVIPFHATVVVDGNLEANTSGYGKASDLLSERERTIPFTGSITVDGLSDVYIDNEEAPQPMQCTANGKAVVMTTQDFDYPANGLTPQLVLSR